MQQYCVLMVEIDNKNGLFLSLAIFYKHFKTDLKSLDHTCNQINPDIIFFLSRSPTTYLFVQQVFNLFEASLAYLLK